MIIDLPTYNLLVGDCCPCGELPYCNENQIECESITVQACGFSLPQIDSLPLEESCLLFKKKFVRTLIAYDVTSPQGSGSHKATSDVDRTTNYETYYEPVSSGGDCLTKITATTSYSYATGTTRNSSNVITSAQTSLYESSSNGPGTCSGTYTYTSHFPPQPATGGNEPWNVCNPEDWTPDDDWSYAGGTYTLVQNTPIPPGSSGTDTSTYTVSYTEQVQVSDLEAEIDLRTSSLTAWPGSQCYSSANYSFKYDQPLSANPPPSCQQITSATQARYKMGVPFAYQLYNIQKEDWDECEAVNPGLCGPPPVFHEPPFKYFSIQWDVVFFPIRWDTWQQMYDDWIFQTEQYEQYLIDYAQWEEDYAQWLIDHAAWQIAYDEYISSPEYIQWLEDLDAFNEYWECVDLNPETPEVCGEPVPYPQQPCCEPFEPYEPFEPSEVLPPGPEPGEQPTPPPTFLQENLFWEWTGSEDDPIDTMFSDWYEIPIPDGAGQARICNKQVKCFRSKIGVPPTFYGEIFNPLDYE